MGWSFKTGSTVYNLLGLVGLFYSCFFLFDTIIPLACVKYNIRIVFSGVIGVGWDGVIAMITVAKFGSVGATLCR